MPHVVGPQPRHARATPVYPGRSLELFGDQSRRRQLSQSQEQRQHVFLTMVQHAVECRLRRQAKVEIGQASERWVDLDSQHLQLVLDVDEELEMQPLQMVLDVDEMVEM